MKYLALIALMLPLAACDFVNTTTGEKIDPVSKLPGHHETVATAPANPAADAALNPAQQAYAAANERMHMGMGTIDADPDVAFMQGMIPHHQGAIDMADAALKYAKDPKVRDLATRVKAAQTGEIAEIQAWLDARKGGATASPPTPPMPAATAASEPSATAEGTAHPADH